LVNFLNYFVETLSLKKLINFTEAHCPDEVKAVTHVNPARFQTLALLQGSKVLHAPFGDQRLESSFDGFIRKEKGNNG
jgi:hypothetical protein